MLGMVALMFNRNSPSEKTAAGSVKIISAGRTTALTIPSSSAPKQCSHALRFDARHQLRRQP